MSAGSNLSRVPASRPDDFFTNQGVLRVEKLARMIEREGHLKVGADPTHGAGSRINP